MAKPVTLQWPSVLQRQWKLPKTTSVAGSRGDWITIASGYAKRAAAASAYLVGILTADWTNDTTNDPVSITVDEYGIYIMDASTTLVQASHVGNAYDVSDQVTVDLGATTTKVFRIVGISPDGRAYVGINKAWIGSGAA